MIFDDRKRLALTGPETIHHGSGVGETLRSVVFCRKVGWSAVIQASAFIQRETENLTTIPAA